MLTRRAFLALGAASVALLAAGSPALAQAAEATAFVRQLGSQLVAVVNGPGAPAAKRARIEPLIGQAVSSLAGQGAGPSATRPRWPTSWGSEKTVECDFAKCVFFRGGEYFFAPSISFLKGLR